MPVRVQSEDFDVGAQIAALRAGDGRIGAIACFVGTVRELGQGDRVAAMTLEHYPGMTVKAIEEICALARSRWEVLDLLVIHRYGELAPADQIVLVAVASAHRADAFAACEFVIDQLKTRAPFWKKETTPQGPRWVRACESDDRAAERWQAGAPRRADPRA